MGRGEQEEEKEGKERRMKGRRKRRKGGKKIHVYKIKKTSIYLLRCLVIHEVAMTALIL